MTNKQSGALIPLGSLAALLFALSFVGCSLETSDYGRSTFKKQTYVRSHPRPEAALKRLAEAAQTPYHGVVAERPRIVKAKVVKLAEPQGYERYAVAYGKPYAVAQDSSIIPFALQSKRKPLKRLEFPFFKKLRKKSEERNIQHLVENTSRLRVRTTAYTHNEWDHVKYGRKTALGTRLRFGKVRSAAADWSRYPVGTQFKIEGQPGILYEVDDYGSALVGTGTVDLYKPTFSAMNRWGVRHVNIEVVKWGSFAKSLNILKGRTKWSHIRRMVASIHQRGTTESGRLTALLLHHGRKQQG